jgi:hypothetical protein
MTRPVKNVTLNIRTVPSIRAMVAKLAKADERSIAQTVERLIRAEYQRKQEARP